MRLINLRTRRLQEVADSELLLMQTVTAGAPAHVQNYAVLSHTWTGQELSLADYMCIQDEPSSVKANQLKQRAGWSKIQGFLSTLTRFVQETPWLQRVEWAWVDTCCIDKSSSSELSEAINSMYSWYERSAICFAFLQDITTANLSLKVDTTIASSILMTTPPRRYFTRGWTLQELIAPNEVFFFNVSWQYIGSKRAPETAEVLSKITKIPSRILTKEISCWRASVSQRMKWASSRTTTRPEDEAYCLMGLFDINMPLLYGEGRKAFIRLQEAIMATHNDHTIFTWTSNPFLARTSFPVLAGAVMDFKGSDECNSASILVLRPNISYIELVAGRYTEPPLPYQVTNTGLQIQLPVTKASAHFSTSSTHCTMECELALLNVVAMRTEAGVDSIFSPLHACIYIVKKPGWKIHSRSHGDKIVWLGTKEVLDMFTWKAEDHRCRLATTQVYLLGQDRHNRYQ